MRRRGFLKLIAAGSLAGHASFAQEIVPRQPQRVLLTIAGINATTSAATLGMVLATLVVSGVPLNLVIETGESPEHLKADSEIGSLVLRYAESFPGLIEVVAWCPQLGNLAPFQAARAAQDVRRSLFGALYPATRSGADPRPLLSVACKAPLDSNAASATLAAGFRCVLEIPGAPVDFRPTPAFAAEARLDRLGVLSLLGGEPSRFQDAAALLSLPGAGLQRHLVFQAADIERTPVETLLAATQEVAQVLKQATLDLSMISVLASDVQMRTEIGFRRRVAIHVLEPAADAQPSETGALEDLLQALRAEAVPYSLGAAPKDVETAQKGGLSYWVPLGMPEDAQFNPDLAFGTFADNRLAFARPDIVEAQDLRFGVVVRPDRNLGLAGLSQNAELGVPVLALIGANGGGIEPGDLSLATSGDGVILVVASAFQSAAMRAALVLAIRKVLLQPDVRMMSLVSYCAEILPKDPLLPALLLTRSKAIRKSPKPGMGTNKDSLALMEDAQAAWNYFDNSTIDATGLCPATMISENRPTTGHLAVSMWEVGSHINALIAAVDLGLISDDDFTARTTRIIRTVERGSRKRLVLPPETIDARTGKGTTRFNSYDTGRLLIALSRLNRHRLAPKGLADLVASWDFAKVILNRRMHSYRQQQMVDDFSSNYSDYVAAGMRLWGLDVASPMDGVAELKSADEQATLLARTVSFGVLGAEPSFLHLLEMGSAPVPEFLADCIDALQLRLAIETGIPAAPSETPLDRSPWFTYQGFDIRNIAAPWALEVAESYVEDIEPDDLVALQATSTKAAYMWHALRPNEHSAVLIDSLREKARKPFGFDSALYFATQASTAGYADLNTNAIVLESVAHLLLSQ
jgi:hypothetical protein